MVRELAADDVVQMLEVMTDVAPEASRELAGELCGRLDLAPALRERVADLLGEMSTPPRPRDERPMRPTLVTVLVDAGARMVVIATRKHGGLRRWRRWAVLVGPNGQIDDCLHEADIDGDGRPLVASLTAGGYRIASTDLDHARAVIAAAARLSADAPDHDTRLTSSYYVGRDLLDLGDAHLGNRARPTASALGRSIELVQSGHGERARALLAVLDGPDAAGAMAASLLADDQPAAALDWIARAIALEPAWPLHHWNHAIALRATGDVVECLHALRRFVATSAAPTALRADPEQPGRLACAERLLAELERTARLTGRRSQPRRRRPRARDGA
jgi:hypothetical protein